MSKKRVTRYNSGFEFLGKHSYRDFGLTLEKRILGQPNKIKIKRRPPFSNSEIDFSLIYGDQVYEERKIVYRFNMVNRKQWTKQEMVSMRTRLLNWLINSKGKQPLRDDHYPGFYFLAEVEEEAPFDEKWDYGTIDVQFVAYPFMIDERPEGHDLWDDFRFDVDYAQETKYSLPDVSDFKPLKIGTTATIGAWATQYARSSGGGKIHTDTLGFKGIVLESKPLVSSRSKRAYTIEGLEGDVVEQDILEAYKNPLEIHLINPGTPSVTPQVLLQSKATIVKDGVAYNFAEGGTYVNHRFQLDSGINNLEIYSFNQNNIEFIFNKELI